MTELTAKGIVEMIERCDDAWERVLRDHAADALRYGISIHKHFSKLTGTVHLISAPPFKYQVVFSDGTKSEVYTDRTKAEAYRDAIVALENNP